MPQNRRADKGVFPVRSAREEKTSARVGARRRHLLVLPVRIESVKSNMSTHGTTEPSPAAELEQHEEEAHNDGEQETVVSEEVKLLRRKRGRQLAAFSRICHRADAMIVGRGSRSKLKDMLETIDAALENVIAANDSLEVYLNLPE